MADNYLENKMDEYRRGLLGAGSRRKTTPSGHAGGCASFLPFPPGLRVLVMCESAEPETIKALVDAGCRVAFTGLDRKAGATTARMCGAQHHPVSPSDLPAVEKSLEFIRHHWRGGIQAVISYGFRIPETDAFRIIIGQAPTGDFDVSLNETAGKDELLWAILPQTMAYFSAKRPSSL